MARQFIKSGDVVAATILLGVVVIVVIDLVVLGFIWFIR